MAFSPWLVFCEVPGQYHNSQLSLFAPRLLLTRVAWVSTSSTKITEKVYFLVLQHLFLHRGLASLPPPVSGSTHTAFASLTHDSLHFSFSAESCLYFFKHSSVKASWCSSYSVYGKSFFDVLHKISTTYGAIYTLLQCTPIHHRSMLLSICWFLKWSWL